MPSELTGYWQVTLYWKNGDPPETLAMEGAKLAQLQARWLAGPVTRCPECNGTGKLPIPTDAPQGTPPAICEACQGVGTIPSDRWVCGINGAFDHTLAADALLLIDVADVRRIRAVKLQEAEPATDATPETVPVVPPVPVPVAPAKPVLLPPPMGATPVMP